MCVAMVVAARLQVVREKGGEKARMAEVSWTEAPSHSTRMLLFAGERGQKETRFGRRA